MTTHSKILLLPLAVLLPLTGCTSVSSPTPAAPPALVAHGSSTLTIHPYQASVTSPGSATVPANFYLADEDTKSPSRAITTIRDVGPTWRNHARLREATYIRTTAYNITNPVVLLSAKPFVLGITNLPPVPATQRPDIRFIRPDEAPL